MSEQSRVDRLELTLRYIIACAKAVLPDDLEKYRASSTETLSAIEEAAREALYHAENERGNA